MLCGQLGRSSQALFTGEETEPWSSRDCWSQNQQDLAPGLLSSDSKARAPLPNHITPPITWATGLKVLGLLKPESQGFSSQVSTRGHPALETPFGERALTECLFRPGQDEGERGALAGPGGGA